MDGDIFLTLGLPDGLMGEYQKAESEGRYAVGIVAPLMAVNSYGYQRSLERTENLREYEERFGNAVSERGGILTDTAIAEYMWDKMLSLNAFAKRMGEYGEEYIVCCHRFSIGCS